MGKLRVLVFHSAQLFSVSTYGSNQRRRECQHGWSASTTDPHLELASAAVDVLLLPESEPVMGYEAVRSGEGGMTVHPSLASAAADSGLQPPSQLLHSAIDGHESREPPRVRPKWLFCNLGWLHKADDLAMAAAAAAAATAAVVEARTVSGGAACRIKGKP